MITTLKPILLGLITMKIYLIPLIILSFYACSDQQRNEDEHLNNERAENGDTRSQTEPIEQHEQEIKFNETSGQAVLIGDHIELLDNQLNFARDISNLSGKIVSLKRVSDSLFNKGEAFEEFCEGFWYVEIEYEEIKGIVNGRQVFKILDLNEGKRFTIDGHTIDFLRTEFFGMGVAYEGDLVGCPANQPIVIKDESNSFFGLVDLVPNEFSKEASWGESYPFFELTADDGSRDEIESVSATNDGIVLKIHRDFQEGENESEVRLTFENKRYKAEYLNFGAIRYE